MKIKGNLTDEANRLSSWVGKDCCTWKGVGCSNKTGHVVKLDLRNPIPPSGLFFEYDTNFEMNKLGGQYLNLSYNYLPGPIPDTLGRLTSLTVLDLSSNDFNDSMSYSLCNLSSLVHLDLSHSSLIGAIPHCLGNLASLSILRLNTNYYLQGPIPSEMGNMTQLTELDLHNSGFQGPIPREMGNMTQLKELDLSQNLFECPIPSEMGNMTRLTELHLSSNAFACEIPNSMRNLCNLRVLDLSDNICLDDKSSDGDHKHADESKVADETDFLWFYTGIGPGFLVGFLGVCGTLNFKKSWRDAYFQFIENNYNWISINIAIKLAQLRRMFNKGKFGG
ncbi:Receptor-like protein 35 [Camellia lanceoleosa]|uniref:Receptor-like protein 35 n=1 Tax=Camellia lanceoleosa TaxID=1840588 RepID=A0ACC0G0K9_9ERIC|nr:Receptor-like protein 35 [Camellia lanceoleosa]